MNKKCPRKFYALDMFFSGSTDKSNPKGMAKRETRPGGVGSLQMTSNAFEHMGMIPKKYTCDGENINPSLEISNVPPQAQSLVLIVHDPDAPIVGGWTHWVVFNISPAATSIAQDSVPENAVEGMTNYDEPGYRGPCPPTGVHHYHFKLYALDSMLTLNEDATKSDLEKAMSPYIIEQTVLSGLYRREK